MSEKFGVDFIARCMAAEALEKSGESVTYEAGENITFTENTSTGATVINAIDEVPASTVADSGKVLTVNASGDAEWTTPAAGVTDYDLLSHRPAINGHTLTGDQTGADLGLVVPADLNDYLTSASAANTYQTQAGMSSYATQTDIADMATETWVGQQGFLTSADEVPIVTSSDDGKILTADYTGGVGSYAWTSPQTFSQQQADWAETDPTAVDYIQNKPSLAAVATSGSYSDLSGKPNLATVAISGDYDDLTNKPTIPAAQVNADWNASSGVAEILNKPTLGTAAAANTSDFATAAQGAKADTAVQPTDLSSYATQTDIADMATETWVGQQGYITSADEVPTVGSSDDGKVLTASYSGGVGSYAWVTPSGGGGSGLQIETDGNNYWITVNGIRLYFASSAPAGTIPDGSMGIGW